MSSGPFRRGFDDQRAGRGFADDYERQSTAFQEQYERGRQFALVLPRNIPLRIGFRINIEAARIFLRTGSDII
jgi:hypothetical protein